MSQITVLQEFIAELDLSLPWLLPALETFEQVFPGAVRIPVCAMLVAWFVVLRHRHAESAESRLHHLAL